VEQLFQDDLVVLDLGKKQIRAREQIDRFTVLKQIKTQFLSTETPFTLINNLVTLSGSTPTSDCGNELMLNRLLFD
jgi:hypothetical protein